MQFGQWVTLLKAHTHSDKYSNESKSSLYQKQGAFFATEARKASATLFIRKNIMRILIYSKDKAAGEWIKDTLEEYGRGMHIIVRDEENNRILNGNFSCIITLGEAEKDVPEEKLHFNYPTPGNEEEYASLRRRLWILYRDTLRDMIGSKCSCGLYDVCHCH